MHFIFGILPSAGFFFVLSASITSLFALLDFGIVLTDEDFRPSLCRHAFLALPALDESSLVVLCPFFLESLGTLPQGSYRFDLRLDQYPQPKKRLNDGILSFATNFTPGPTPRSCPEGLVVRE